MLLWMPLSVVRSVMDFLLSTSWSFQIGGIHTCEPVTSRMATPQTLDDQVTCSICSDHFSKPKGLPCFHTLCRHCLVSYIQSQAHGEEGLLAFACPLCRQDISPPNPSAPVVEWAEQFPTHHTMISLMECRSIQETRDATTTTTTSITRTKENREPMSCQQLDPFRISGGCTGATYLSDGSLTLVEDGRLRFYDISYRLIYDQWSSKWSTHTNNFGDVTRICGDIVAATNPTQKEIQIHTKGTASREATATIRLVEKCYGITNVSDRGMLVTCDGKPECIRKDGNPESIKVLRPDGSLMYLFPLKQGRTVPSGNTYIATNAGASCIVVTDSEQDCVQCFSSEGRLEWERKIPGASGAAIVGSYILVAAKTDDKVQVLDIRGNTREPSSTVGMVLGNRESSLLVQTNRVCWLWKKIAKLTEYFAC
jgi:hypothetical protein